ncbi:MAG: hypothetical protein HGA41_04000, partial [Syntrophaceae bacterium]|nr:hypothetical protein [Syntrophaceae bacterium]
EQLDVLYQWEIAPFFKNGGRDPGDARYRCTPERADDVRQVGFIICEKICRKIQEADYIVADLSFDNPNVFYELGLAAALRKEIVPICAGDLLQPRQSRLLSELGIPKLLPYPRFDMLEERINDYVWRPGTTYADFEQMSGDHIAILQDIRHTILGSSCYGDKYDFGALCRTAVGTAAAEIFSESNMKQKPELRLYDKVRIEAIKVPKCVCPSGSPYGSVIEACKSSACVLVDVTVEEAAANFFWLGYIHGIGGNAIPVNSYSRDTDKGERPAPFDIRALWHVAFRDDHPKDLLTSLQQILEHIYIRKARNLNREAFWKDILKDNRVSIFLGSLYLEGLGRNTIGDWDYRTAAEITNYLSTSKETMKVTLESPLPKREGSLDVGYIKWLKNQLRDNTIIVASADVNDLTEVALCNVLGLEPFTPILATNKKFKGYIAHKKYSTKAEQLFPETAFYVREKGDEDSRGFIIQEGAALRKELMEKHAYPKGGEMSGVRRLLGQLVVAKNPFTKGKWIVIVSGISGPATLGIAQMLTGCMYKEFTINNLGKGDDAVRNQIEEPVSRYSTIVREGSPLPLTDVGRIPYEALSEHMLTNILKTAELSQGEVNALIAVDVYYPPKSDSTYSNDERKIIGWEFVDITDFLGKPWANPNDLGCRFGDNEIQEKRDSDRLVQ